MKTRTILIQYSSSNTEQRVQVPDDATVTFGGLIPGAKSDGGSNRTALRVYVGKRQIAVFTNVSNFRFMEEVTVLEKQVREAQKQVVVSDGDLQRNQTVTVRTEEWLNPDTVVKANDKEFNKLQIEAGG